jgi:hypothetical protein
MLWVATEWQLPRCPRIGRTPTKALFDYCETHGVSLDWMLDGDLKGLQRMMQRRRMGKPPVTPESLEEKLVRLSESDREVIRKIVDQLVEECS